MHETPASSLPDAGWLWNARIAAAGVERAIVSRTALLVRAAADADINGSIAHSLMLPSALLADRDFAKSASLAAAPVRRTSPRERVERLPRPVAAAARLAIDTVRPARDALRRARSSQHGSAVPEWLAAELREQNRFEPAVPFPRASALGEYRMVAAGGREGERAAAYWRLRAALPDSVDYLFFAPWVRTGGGDLMLAHYIGAVRRLDPDASVALITTEFSTSTRLDLLPDGVDLFELSSIASASVDREWCVEHLIPQLIAQLQPSTVHAFNSTVAFDVIERHGAALAPTSALFLSTYVIDRTPDGERTSVLFYRRDGFLDPVTAVLVDSEAFVQTMSNEFGFDPAKFLVQRNIVDTTFGTRGGPVRGVRPFRVLWAGRFDVQKRVDVLAAIAVEIERLRLPVEVHFYGEEVMGDPALPDHLRALEAAGAHRHPPFTGGFSNLPIEQYDAFLMTSEWEGVPNMMLEALAAGLPVIAPTVGGIGEVLTSEIGYPIARFDDIDAYVSTIAEILEHPDDAARRATSARSSILSDYSVDTFDARLASTRGYLRGDA
ncbi:glycosyltransferase family 4 protein [Agromyces sp. CCNWLW203]|uniref:glycosyltransferase family 4 protein n=1 Tax=Agromyces sp. CCNWLW203 TaxID=3112842 RepID=UPI002F96C304